MKYYHDSPLLYEKGLSIIINDVSSFHDLTVCYQFDYDQRNQAVNMEFPHFHSFYEIMIPLSSKVYHMINGKRYDLMPNDIVLLAPSVLHQSEYPSGPPSDRIIIAFMFPKKWALFDEGYKEILSIFNSPSPIFRFHRNKQETLFAILNDIVNISQRVSSTTTRSLMIHNKFVEFLSLLYSMKEYNCYTPNTERGIKEKIYAVTNYIHMHYHEDISLTTLADYFVINPCYLSHRFREITGYTVVQYIQMTRIKNAQYLLSNSNEKITQISEDTGFSSFSQFNRVFRKICGMSPSDYKVKLQQTDKTVVLSSINL